LKIDHHNGDFRTGYNQNQKHQKQKGEQIIKLMQPQTTKNEEQLNKDGSKRQDATHQNAHHSSLIPHLRRNLARNLIHLARNFDRVHLVAVVTIGTKSLELKKKLFQIF
jgi:hypothetical protein